MAEKKRNIRHLLKFILIRNYLLKLTKVLLIAVLSICFFTLKLDANIGPDSLARVDLAIKINPLLVFRGEIPFYAEKKISNHLSVEGAVELTRKDPFSGVFDFDLDNLSGNVQGESGFGYRLALRYYLDSSLELDGTYVSFEYAQREMKKSFALTDTLGLELDDRILDIRNFKDFKLIGGLQRLSYYSNLFIDVYAGIGYRMKDFEEVHLNKENEQPSHVIVKNEESNLSLFVGFKIGLGF